MEYQKKELMKDLVTKDLRIKSLEKDVTELSELVGKLRQKLNIATEGLKHIHFEENWVIAGKCLNEIDEA